MAEIMYMRNVSIYVNAQIADLAALEPDDARVLMPVTGGRTVYELRGISCMPLELVEPTRKGIAVTRSFGAPVTSWQQMREATLRGQRKGCAATKVGAENIFVFMHTNTFNNDPLLLEWSVGPLYRNDKRHR